MFGQCLEEMFYHLDCGMFVFVFGPMLFVAFFQVWLTGVVVANILKSVFKKSQVFVVKMLVGGVRFVSVVYSEC